MNDFTKEELQYIRDYIFREAASIRYDNHERLKEKIQSMIDKYCEHEFQIKSLNPHFLMMCEKCNKTFVNGSFPR